METEIRDQAEDLQELNTELTDLKEKTLAFKVADTNLLRIQELTGRVDELEAKGDNLTQETESQKLLDDARDKTQQESLQSLHDTMNDLKEKTHQEVQAGLDNLNNKLNEMTQTLTQHQTTDTQHSSSIDDILRRLNDVEKASERQTIVNGNLQNELSKLQEVSEQQKITISSLGQEIAEMKKADEALKTANEALSQTLEDVQASSHTEHEELREKTNILTSRLHNEEQTRANSSATMKNQLKAISETLTLNTEQQNLKFSGLQQEITELQEAKEQLITVNRTLSLQLEEVQASCHTEHEELREKTTILTNRLQTEERTRANSSATMKNQLEAISETLTLNREQQNLTFSGLQQEITELQEADEEMKTANETLSLKLEGVQASSQALYEDLREKTTILTNRLQTEERTRANSSTVLQNQLDAISQTHTLNSEQQNLKFSSFQQEITELQKASEELITVNRTLTLQLEDVHGSTQAFYEELREKTNRLTNRVQTEERTRANSAATVQNQLNGISHTLTLNTHQQNVKVSALQQEITDLKEADEALKTANETLNQRLEDVETSAKASFEELREKTDILTNRVQVEEQTRARSSTQLQTRLDELTASQQESIRDLREKSERLRGPVHTSVGATSHACTRVAPCVLRAQ
nr:hypothetical protein BaRGS_019082 [Batillaria attramentaria]